MTVDGWKLENGSPLLKLLGEKEVLSIEGGCR